LHGTKEICITVNNFDDAKALFEALGLVVTSYQETKRESWRLDDLEIELDHWPWTEPYVEIEAPNETVMQDIFAKLSLDYKKAVFGSVEVVYQNEYDVDEATVQNIKTIRFELPVPNVLAAKKRTA
jgi:adenylate cyclase class 2